jgi:hypothetical protein
MLGQSVASNSPSADGQRYVLTDGFWVGSSPHGRIYLPIVVVDSRP